VPEVRRPATGGPQFAALEGQLRRAILSPDARERLVQNALRTTNGDRAAAIRKVLSDLFADNERWS
jgi:DNA-binding TFAR19-related protein (PDSD5 family)